MSEQPPSYRILFVCMGNICRSPAAENVMRRVLQEEGLEKRVQCDSAGTIDFHTGKAPDPRMREAARVHGYEFEGAARQVTAADLEAFDLVLAMDRDNLRDLRALQGEGGERGNLRLFGRYCDDGAFPEEVPDPYYGGESGFHEVIAMVESGCRGLVKALREEGVLS